MDIEARNKFCGLLMFNTFSVSNKGPGSRDNDFSVNNYDSSFSNFFDQPEPYYKSQNDSQETSIAAGAAAPGNQEKQAGCQKAQTEKRPPRPPNAFILYRREKQPAILAANRHLTNAEISRHIASLWRNESNETRLKWERYADQTKLEHMKAFPNYVYRPNKSKGKRRQGRKQNAASTTSPSTSPIMSQQESSTAGPVRPSTRGQNRVNMVGRRIELENPAIVTDFQPMIPTPTVSPLESADVNAVQFDPLNMGFTDANISGDELQLTPITPVTTQQQLAEIEETLGQWRVVPTQPETVNHQGNILFQPSQIFPTFHEPTVDPSMLFLNDDGTAPAIYDHPSAYPQDSKNVSHQKTTNNLSDTNTGFSEFRDNTAIHNPAIAEILAKFDLQNYFGGPTNPLNSVEY